MKEIIALRIKGERINTWITLGGRYAKLRSQLFDLGAGKLGCYDSCAWQTSGTGQFRPLKGSSPYLGEQNRITQVDEYKVELICKNDAIKKIVNKLIEVHPYEEPAYHIIKVYTLADL